MAPAAGWYPDPSDSGFWRWWDGGTWTDHVRPNEHTEPTPIIAAVPQQFEPEPDVAAPVATAPAFEVHSVEAPDPERDRAEASWPPAPVQVDPVPVQAEPALPAPAQAEPVLPAPVQLSTHTPETPPSEQEYWHSANAKVIKIPGRSATTHASTFRHSGSQDSGGFAASRYAQSFYEPGSPQTAGVWLLASSTLITIFAAVALGVALAFVPGVTDLQITLAARVLSFAILVLCWVWAGLDIKALRERGYSPPKIWWMLLLPPLVYLIMRGRAVRREGKSAWPPELLYFLSWVGLGGVYVAWFLFLQSLTSAFPSLV